MVIIRFPDKAVREKIGLTYVLDRLEIKTPYGKDELKFLKPFKRDDYERIDKNFDELRKVHEIFINNDKGLKDLFKIFGKYRDIRATMNRLSEDIVLDDIEFFELKNFSLTTEELISAYNQLDIELDSVLLYPLDDLIKLLNPYEKIVPSFYIHDIYSVELKNIRTQKKELESNIISEKDMVLQEELRQKRCEIVIREREEEYKVRLNMTKEVGLFKNKLLENIKSIGKLELIIAKAKIATMYQSVCPNIIRDDENLRINITDAINPLLQDSLKVRRKIITPISISVEKGVTILTGANMGGKTVSLSTIVLNICLVSLGFFAFAKEITMPMINNINFVSGDLQDANRGLSSFGAELVRLNDIISTKTDGAGLIIFDEFARSTNPYEGHKFVSALCEYLGNIDSFGIVSTHYDGIVVQGANYYQVIGLQNADFENLKDEVLNNKGKAVEMLSSNMDYRLVKVDSGKNVPRDAFKIAQLMGSEHEFLEILAKKY